MESLYIVLPAYNEEANIEKVIDEWYPLVECHHGDGKSRLVILDDGSTDQTFKIASALSKSRPLLEVIEKPNSGHGGTVLSAYHYALEQGADYIFQTDSDGQTSALEFPPFWDMRRDYAMVIGHRCKREDGISRILVTKILKLVIRICFGVSITDANTPFRLMQAEPLRSSLALIPSDFNLSNVMISVIFAMKAYPVKYMPITFRPRQGGKNSINLKKIFMIGKQAVKDFAIIKRKITLTK